MLESAVAQMFNELDEFLNSRPLNRLYLPHGYRVSDVKIHEEVNPFCSALRSKRAEISIKLPVVWEIERGSFPARASDVPVTDEPEVLRQMLQSYVESGGLAGAGKADFADWRLERDLDALPSRGTARDTEWTATVSIVTG